MGFDVELAVEPNMFVVAVVAVVAGFAARLANEGESLLLKRMLGGAGMTVAGVGGVVMVCVVPKIGVVAAAAAAAAAGLKMMVLALKLNAGVELEALEPEPNENVGLTPLLNFFFLICMKLSRCFFSNQLRNIAVSF
jgi:alanine dehydrogenase